MLTTRPQVIEVVDERGDAAVEGIRILGQRVCRNSISISTKFTRQLTNLCHSSSSLTSSIVRIPVSKVVEATKSGTDTCSTNARRDGNVASISVAISCCKPCSQEQVE